MMLHPALRQLLRAQFVAKVWRVQRAFSTRRRCLLSLLAIMLAVFWFGNIVMSVILREPTSPERFNRMVAIGLFVYALWRVIKTAFARPEDALEWTPAEREMLWTAPFQRHDLIWYRFVSIVNTSAVKAACFTLLMLRDLRQPFAGFLGMLLALIFLDLLRLNVEITVHGLARPTYHRFRSVVGVLCGGVVISSLVIAFSDPPDWNAEPTRLTWTIARHVLDSSLQLLDTVPGRIVFAPFQWFTVPIVAASLSTWLASSLVSVLIIVALGASLVHWDHWFDQRIRKREQQAYPPPVATDTASAARVSSVPSWKIAWFSGAGPIAWRQWIGANRQWSHLAVALALPGILAALPIFVCPDPTQAALHVAAAVTFYSFLLLPTALKFDFRRDIERMGILKSLPIRPVAVAIGQIITPTLLAFGFQAMLMCMTMVVKPFPLRILVGTLLLLAPLNALIFAIDNLIFLLYPYRLNQEGIEIFLRTTLTFTAKGLMFTLGLLLTVAWVFAAGQIARQLPESFQDTALVFVAGGWMMLCVAAYGVIQLLARAYLRFDPSQDTPA